jgi:hypothetical protein
LNDIVPPYSAFASIGSTTRREIHFAAANPASPSTNPPSDGTSNARSGSTASCADKYSPRPSAYSARCIICASSDIATTTAPAPAPTDPAKTTSQISSARTTARNLAGAWATTCLILRRCRKTLAIAESRKLRLPVERRIICQSKMALSVVRPDGGGINPPRPIFLARHPRQD